MASSIGNPSRLGSLDSIRGIAALSVVLGHCWLLNPDDFQNAHYGLSHAFSSVSNLLLYFCSKFNVCSRSAVIIFFVLSGFVLALSLSKRSTPYFGYLVKRIFRIYPAFLFVIVASYVLHIVIGIRHLGMSPWVESTIIDDDLTWQALAEHLTFFGTNRGERLDAVIWSLVHEMRISLVFPVILWSLKRYQWRSFFAFWMISVACTLGSLTATGVVVLGFETTSFVGTFWDTGFFMVFFAAGAYLAIKRESVATKVTHLPVWVQKCLLLMVAACFVKSDFDPHFLLGNVVDYMRGMGAVGLIALVLGVKKFDATLNHGFFVWLGRISYSLYLVHIPILYVLNQTVGWLWPTMQTSIALILLSLLAAEIIARWIEEPFIRLGKRICATPSLNSGS